MRHYISLPAIAILGISIFTGCQRVASTTETARTEPAGAVAPEPTATPKTNSNTAPAETADDAPRISLADAKKAFDDGHVTFIDTRAEATYLQEHIKGAINIPAESFQTRYAEVPKGKMIVAYCS